MSNKKSVMLIGLEPTEIDFSSPDFANLGLDVDKIKAGLDKAEDDIRRLGHEIVMCLIDTGATAEEVVRERLQRRFDCIVIGAGIRAMPSQLLLFEKLINVVHEHAPQAKLCFNTTPEDSAEAVSRWI